MAKASVVGVDISRRQMMRLLIAGQDYFLDEVRDVLRAGLTDAARVSVDDTGARHKAANGVCTQIGNDHFAWFGTTTSKSRLNFLHLLRAGHADYMINAEALAYMRGRGLPGPVITRLAEQTDRHFADAVQWQAHLARLDITSPVEASLQAVPEIPLHTNGSENDIRCQVTKRKVSFGTRSDIGRDCRDAFLGLVKTCAKLRISFWDYLGSRLAVPGCQPIPCLPALVTLPCRSP